MKYKNLKVGILAIQGDFERHHHQLNSLGVEVREVRLPRDLKNLDGLIIPGGESTTMNIMLDRFDLRQPVTDFAQSKPVWGTCAGMIMLANAIEDNISGVKPLGLIDIDVVRNGYGRQVFSFEASIQARLNGSEAALKASFIRAPRITRIGDSVQVLAEYKDSPVLVAQGHILASSFHTELEDETLLTECFLNKFLLELTDH